MFSVEHQANICARQMVLHRSLCLILPFPLGAFFLMPGQMGGLSRAYFVSSQM